MSKKAQEKVTLYVQGMFGVSKIEGRLVEHGTRKYAQYDNAAYVALVPKRKRKARVWTGMFQPYLLLLKGHGHPDVPEAFETRNMGGVEMKISKYTAHDSRHQTDMDAVLDAYLENTGAEVLADYRHTKGFNAHDRYRST